MNTDDVQRLGTIQAARAQGFLDGYRLHEGAGFAWVRLERAESAERGASSSRIFESLNLSRALELAERWLIEEQVPSRVPANDECLHGRPLAMPCADCVTLLEAPTELAELAALARSYANELSGT